MLANWTNLWGLCSNYNVTTVAALPHSYATLFEYFHCFDVVKKLAVSFFMLFFNSTYATGLLSKLMKSFFICFLS